MYEYSIENGLTYNGRRVPHLLHLESPKQINQMTLDVLCHFFRDEADAERKAYALHLRLKPKLVTRFVEVDWCMSDDELVELVTLTLCEQREHVSRQTDLVYLDGQRFLRDEHGNRIN